MNRTKTAGEGAYAKRLKLFLCAAILVVGGLWLLMPDNQMVFWVSLMLPLMAFSLMADHYKWKVTGLIAGLGWTVIMGLCQVDDPATPFWQLAILPSLFLGGYLLDVIPWNRIMAVAKWPFRAFAW